MAGFKLAGKQSTGGSGTSNSPAYLQKATRELTKNDEVAKQLADQLLPLATQISENFVLKANNGQAFEDTKEDGELYTPKVVVKISHRKSEVALKDANSKEIEVGGKKVYPDLTVNDLADEDKGNLSKLYSMQLSYTIKGQTLSVYGSARPNDKGDGFDVALVTPMVSQYNAREPKNSSRAKGYDEIASASWVKPEMKAVAEAFANSGLTVEKVGGEAKAIADKLNEDFKKHTITVPAVQRNEDGRVVKGADGKPIEIAGQTEQAAVCYAKASSYKGNDKITIFNREYTNLAVELGMTAGGEGKESEAFAKVVDFSTNENDEPRTPQDGTKPKALFINSVEDLAACTPPDIPELAYAIAEHKGFDMKEVELAISGRGDDGVGGGAAGTPSEVGGGAADLLDFEEILNDANIPFN